MFHSGFIYLAFECYMLEKKRVVGPEINDNLFEKSVSTSKNHKFVVLIFVL